MDQDSVQIKASGNISLPVPLGHEAVFESLKRSFVSGRAVHAYLVTGRAGSGRFGLARALAAHLLDTDALESQPDFCLVERGLDPKTSKPRTVIAIDQVQVLRGRLSRTAFLGGWQVAVIRDAQYLNRESGNALLKTLEEPHGQTLLLLTAPDAESVLPTVRSRCQEIRLPRISTSAIKDGLAAMGVLPSDASLLARLADGCPARAIRYVTEPQSLAEMRGRRDQLLALSGIDYASRWQVVEKILPKKLPFQDAQERTRDFLDLTAELLHDVLLLRHGQIERLIHLDAIDGIRRWSNSNFDPQIAAAALQEARLQVDGNVGPRAVLQSFVLSL
ncbi:hypothetical protein COY93_03900 [Candidatus Uhrbacteria bacterium CG_4_10_14_0_8_um_filter_58_22]|uniref:DNA polymerase III subunit delta n=1 Tax=Candidatus Uhrbacteria bacterium CG_4_10_14_0_8_um_filter_58_22 TaxID=1975029 RepID=A0A2M7QAA0_9BACT|nr:MAG: hypothetical protein AUJ19_00545 [Parcubacteria group bacterium CG1_02_58_44]PIY62131.1 MAG: hypothetical protein COY93_03900 [Candidatus Uhrbacteria bacterium CG_4_10_14_0_8_um_filter_58_22]